MKQLFFLIVISIFFSCSNDSVQSDTKPLPENSIVQEVDTIQIGSRNFSREIISNGKINASQKCDLTFTIAGIVAKVLVNNGGFIKKDSLIIVLDNRQQRIALEQARNELNEARLLMRDLLIQYGYSDTANVPSNQLEVIKVKSGFNKAVTNYKNTELALQNTYLKAPFDGIVSNLQVKAGNYMGINQVVCTLLDPVYMEASFFILETELGKIQKGQEVNITAANSDKVYKGVLSEINPSVSENGLITAKAKFQNTGELIDGMNVTITIEQHLKNQIVIPKKAMVLRGGKQVVFTYEGGRSKWNYVKSIGENSSQYCIGEGLKPGDKVIVSGNFNLGDQSQVTIKGKAAL